MAKSSDWLPGTRTGILAMCLSWILYPTQARRTAWGVPEAEFTELGTLAGTLELDPESDYGYAVYVCCRYENRKGEAGQWGPVASAVIP
ncbi:MAG: hypothetical protein LBC51_12040 [Treponema sp.]|jgi:hypothetical protein|nr:hypothetical protein [Treponema sp.]